MTTARVIASPQLATSAVSMSELLKGLDVEGMVPLTKSAESYAALYDLASCHR